MAHEKESEKHQTCPEFKGEGKTKKYI